MPYQRNNILRRVEEDGKLLSRRIKKDVLKKYLGRGEIDHMLCSYVTHFLHTVNISNVEIVLISDLEYFLCLTLVTIN